MGRHNALHSLACSLRAKGGDEDDIAQGLLAAPERYNASGETPEDEVRRIAKSVCDKYQRGEAYRRFEDGFFTGKSPLEEFASRRALSMSALQSIGVVGHDKMTGLLMSSKFPDKGFDFERMIEFPMRDASGAQVGRKLRRATCGGIWGAAKEGKPALKSTNETSASGRKDGLFYVHPLPADGTVLVVEGEMDWCAGHDAGAQQVVGTPGSGCGTDVVKYLKAVLKGRDVILAPDGDDAGRKWCRKVGAALANAQCRVRVVIPEEGMDLDKRLNPCLDRPAEMKRLIAEAEEWIEEGADAKAAKKKQSLDAAKVSPDGGELIEVPIVADEKHMAKQVVAALAKKSKELYQREGRLVRCVYKPIAGSMALDAIPLPALRSEISSVCLFTKDGEPGKYQKHIGEDIHSMRNWDGIRPIRSVVNSPVMRKDGTIWQDEGWDSQTMVYHHPSFTLPPIPNNPSKEDAKEASKVLLDIICDFPVVSDACRSAWISMVLTILFRNLVDGPCPLFFVQANMRRAGKGKMANIAANITLGKKFAANSYIHDEQEMDKRIVMFGMSGEPVCFIDNVGGPFGLKCLDAALTSTTYNARLMHTQTPVTVQMEGVWVATGNHPQTAADTGLRMLPIHIEHPMERPEQRDISECKHPDPVAEALRDRKKYVAAAFTMVRAWMAAGSPRLIKLDWGSFEAWGDFARNVCVFAGLPDPFDAREELKDADNDDVDVLASLLQGLYALTMNGTKPLSSVEIIERLKSESGPASLLKTMVTEHCGWALRGDTGNPNYLGKYLSAHRNRYAGGYKLVWSRISGKAVWCVEKAGEAKAGGAKIETLPLLPPRQLDAFGRASAHAGAGYVADPDDDTNEDKRSMPF